MRRWNRGLCVVLYGSLAVMAAAGAQVPGPATLENLLSPDQRPRLRLPGKAAGAPRTAVPDPEAIDRAVELIRQAYEEDFQRVGDMPEPLIQKLLVAAAQTEEVARKYAALLEAQQVAVTGGDFGRAIELVDIRATEFDIDAAQGRLDLLAKLLTPKAKTDPNLLSTLYVHCMETAETAISAASWSARSRTCSRGTSSSARPMRNASSPPMRRPV